MFTIHVQKIEEGKTADANRLTKSKVSVEQYLYGTTGKIFYKSRVPILPVSLLSKTEDDIKLTHFSDNLSVLSNKCFVGIV